MKKILIISVIAILAAPTIALTCKPARVITQNMEPVTIKIGNHFFDIPQAFFTYPNQRVPIEKNEVYFRLPLNNITTIDKENSTPSPIFYIQICKNSNDGCTQGAKKRLYDNIVTSITWPYGEYKDNIENIEKIFNFLKSIGSKSEPINWQKDVDIVEKFKLHKGPCDESFLSPINKKFSNLFNTTISYKDFLYGINNKNDTIRHTFARRAKNIEEEGKIRVTNDLYNRIDKEKSYSVKIAIIDSLIYLIDSNNDIVINKIIDVMLNDKNIFVRRTIARNIIRLNNKIVLHLLTHIKEEGEEQHYFIISTALSNIIDNEILNKSIGDYKNFSKNSKIALGAIIKILKLSKSHENKINILNELSNLKGDRAPKEFIEIRNIILNSPAPLK